MGGASLEGVEGHNWAGNTCSVSPALLASPCDSSFQ